MARLSDTQIATLARGAGFRGDGLVLAIAVCLAESEGNTNATNNNASPPSRDRGLWQINDLYHKDVSDQCAFDPACNARAAYRISSSGTNWQPWAAYNNKSYQKYLPRARAAAGGAPAPDPTRPANRPAPAAGTVVLYSGENFTGRASVVTGQERYIATGYRFGWLNGSAPKNTRVRSIDIPPGARVTVWQKIDFKGTSRSFSQPVPDTTVLMGFTPGDGQSFISSLKIGAGAAGSIGLELGGGDLLDKLAALEQLQLEPEQDSVWRLDLGSVPVPGYGDVSIGGEIPLPGTGYAKMVAKNAAAIAVRLLIVLLGLLCIAAAARNI